MQPLQENAISGNKLKILALHGYRQNAEAFRVKTGSFRKVVQKWADFTYVAAPHVIGQPGTSTECSWFFNGDNGSSFSGLRQGGSASGFEDSVKFIGAIIDKKGPFDGVLGFSQGACFAALLCDLQHRGQHDFGFAFAIFAAGFKSGSVEHAEFLQDKVGLGSMHIFGDGDQVIPVGISEELSRCFEEAEIVRHTGGHYVPAGSQQKLGYQGFVKRMLLQKQNKIV